MTQQTINLDQGYDNRRNLIYRRGDRFQFRINTVDENGDAIDFSGASAIRCQLRKYRTDSNPVLSFSLGSGITAASSYVQLEKSSEDMEDLKPGLYYYDVEVEEADGDIITICSGHIIIRNDVTRI